MQEGGRKLLRHCGSQMSSESFKQVHIYSVGSAPSLPHSESHTHTHTHTHTRSMLLLECFKEAVILSNIYSMLVDTHCCNKKHAISESFCNPWLIRTCFQVSFEAVFSIRPSLSIILTKKLQGELVE